MAIPTAVFSATPRMPQPGALSGRVGRTPPVHVLARLAFWTILLISLTNAIGLFITWMKRLHDAEYELSVYPVVFAACSVVVLAFTKGRQRSALLTVTWAFWLLFFLGGFLGSMQLTTTDIRSALRVTLKPWMAIVGLPWLALRVISEDKVPRLIHVTVIVTCLGAVVGLLQFLAPGLMDNLVASVGRAEGLWANPNTSGVLCAMALFLTLLCPFQSHLLNWSTRLLLLASVAASLSRGAILALLISWVVYTVTARRFGTLVKSVLGLVLFVAGAIAILGALETTTKDQENRVATVHSLLSGDWKARTFTDRTDLWAPALDSILSQGGLLFGLGHGSMGNIVGKVGEGISPHNYFLLVLGNSGIFALFGLLAFHVTLFQQGHKCPDKRQRAAIYAIATLWALAHMVDNSLIGDPGISAVFTCVVVAVAYARPSDPLNLRRQRFAGRNIMAARSQLNLPISQCRISPSRQ